MGAETTYIVTGYVLETHKKIIEVSAVTMAEAEQLAREQGVTQITNIEHWASKEDDE